MKTFYSFVNGVKNDPREVRLRRLDENYIKNASTEISFGDFL